MSNIALSYLFIYSFPVVIDGDRLNCERPHYRVAALCNRTLYIVNFIACLSWLS